MIQKRHLNRRATSILFALSSVVLKTIQVPMFFGSGNALHFKVMGAIFLDGCVILW